jgi:hypothetical protein
MTDLPEAPEKWRCNECDAISSAILSAPNPFDQEDTLHACPECRSVNSLSAACQHPECSKPATGGHPGGLGYRYAWLCWEHSPMNPKNANG